MTTSAPQKVQTPWLVSQMSPSDAPTKVEFGLSSSTSSTSRVDSFTLVPKDEGLRSDYDAQRPFMESSIVSSSYNASCERSAVQPLPNLRVHNRVSSEPCFPSPIGRQTNLLRSEHSILHAKNISIPSIVVDHNGSEIFGSTTIRSNQETSQTFVSFLESDQHHDSILHHNQGGSGHRMSNAMPNSSSNVITYHENEPMGGLAGINLSPPINRTIISEDIAKHFTPSENGLLSSSNNNLFGEDYSPSGKFLLESPYRNSGTNKDGFLRSRAFSSPGPMELSQGNPGLFSAVVHSHSPRVPWQQEYSPRGSSKVVNGTDSHHFRSHTLGFFPCVENDVQHQYAVDSFRGSNINTDDDTKGGSPNWQNLNSALGNNSTPSRSQPQRLFSSKGDVQHLPLSRALSQSSYCSNNFLSNSEMDQSSSFTHAASQINLNDDSNHHHIPAAVLDPNKSTSCAIRTPRSALYYPEKEDHFGQIDQERSFQNEDHQLEYHHLENNISSHVPNSMAGFNTTETAIPTKSTNPSVLNSSVQSHCGMPGYGFQRPLTSPAMNVYGNVQQQQQMNYQPQHVQSQMMPPYLVQQQMMQPMSSLPPYPPFNMQPNGVLSPQQQQHMLVLQHQQAQGIQQHSIIQGQKVFIPGMGTMIMSTSTGPDGESIGHLSFPLGNNSGGSPNNDAIPTMFTSNITTSQHQQSQGHAVNSIGDQGNLSHVGGAYHNTVSPPDFALPSRIASSLDVTHHIPPHSSQQSDVISPQNISQSRVINLGSLNTPPSSPEDDSSAGLIGGDIMKTRSSNAPAVAQTHCNASASISHCVTIEQATLPVHSVNNHKASGGGSVPIDSNSTGSSTPKIVYNVKFKRTQRSFILGPIAPREVKVGSYVKVEADRGEDLGIVISRVPAEKYCTNNSSTSRSGLRSSIGEPPTAGSSAVSCAAGDLKKVVRLATDEEISLLEDKRLEEDALLKICRLKVKQRGLNMNVVDAEYQFDRHKLIFFFEAEGRVDFRELVRDLFSIYKTRIWMQQLDKGGSGVNSVGICTAVGDDLEDDLFTGVDQQDVKSIAVSSPNE